MRMLAQREIPVRSADIGDISRNDIIEAEAVAEHDPYLGAIIGFDVKVLQDAKENAKAAQIITSDVIYDAVEGYVQWAATKSMEDERSALSTMTVPGKDNGAARLLLQEERPGGLRRRDSGGQAQAQGPADGRQRGRAGHGGADTGQREAGPGGDQGDAGRHLGQGSHARPVDQGERLDLTPSPPRTT